MNKFCIDDLQELNIPSCITTIKGTLSQSELTKEYVKSNGVPYIDSIVYHNNTTKQFIGGYIILVPLQDVKLLIPSRAEKAFLKVILASKFNNLRKDLLVLIWR